MEEQETKVERDAKGRFAHGNTFGEGALEGNQHAVKLKTDELKLEAYRQYCQWISEGNSKEAWCFEHEYITLTWQTMENYIKNDPLVFNPIHKLIAECKSYSYWLQLGKKMMVGEMEKCQPAIYQMFMRNKFKWDKEEKKSLEDIESDLRRIARKMME